MQHGSLLADENSDKINVIAAACVAAATKMSVKLS